jgi:hypothetical protein
LTALLLPRLEEAPGALFARALLIMLGTGIGMEIATRSVPLERGAIAWNRLAGVSERRWAAGKALTAGVLGIPLLALAAVAIGMLLEVERGVWLGLAVAALSAFGLSVSVGVLLGARYGDPAWRHPRGMLRLAGRLIATVAVVVQAAGWLVGLGFLEQAPPGTAWVGALVAPPILAAALGALALGAAGRTMVRLI